MTFAPKSSHAQIFFLNLPRRKIMIYYCQKGKKNWGSPTSFWREHASKNTLNLKNRASLADKATVSVSPKILLSDLLNEMFSAKYCLSGPIK